MLNEKSVIVVQLPERLVRGQAHLFFGEIQSFLKGERPRLVFDFSALTHLDSAGVAMLLNSAEEVMKRNGDLKLAAVSPGPAAVLELTRVDGLFEMFNDASEAVESFYRIPVDKGQMATWETGGGLEAPSAA
jgi:anti-sigma B factor antagonist